MSFTRTLATLALAGTTAITFSLPAAAAPLVRNNALQPAATSDGIENVQWREHRHGGHGHRHGHRHGHWGHRHQFGWGPALGGLAAGAIIGGAIANSRAQTLAADDAYCVQRFKSYDPASGTYLGYDGLRHPCP